MIFDRTQIDVNAALSIRETNVKKFETLTDAEIETLERGTMTINTLNRIEEKQMELRGLFNQMGYWNTPTTNKLWDYTQIFDETEFQRIIDNLVILRNAFFTYKDTPKTPNVSYYYEDVNSLEKILHDLDVMINDVKSNYKQCGTFECEEE